jgi:hypothetical protein
MNAAPSSGTLLTTTNYNSSGSYSFSSTFTNLPKEFIVNFIYNGFGSGSALQRGSTNATHYSKGIRTSTNDVAASLFTSSGNRGYFIFKDFDTF